MRNDLSIIVMRQRQSYQYKVDAQKNSFQNNWIHNSLDLFRLTNNRGVVLFSCHVQTIANHPGAKYKLGDSLAVGKFQLRCFVDRRNFVGDIHAIINATDLEGQPINGQAMQSDPDYPGYQSGRWLMHSKYSTEVARDTNFAWSGGCIISSSIDLETFATILRDIGVKPGEIIAGRLIEV